MACKSYFNHNNKVYACKKTTSAHTMLHMNTPVIKSNSISWGSDAPDVVSSPAGVRYYALRGKDEGDDSSEFSYMGIKDASTTNTVGTNTEYASGPFAYEGYDEWAELQQEAHELNTEWENKLKLLDAEAVNTDTCFVEIAANGRSLKLSPSEYTFLFENADKIPSTDFKAGKHVTVHYFIPQVKIYDGKAAGELHQEFLRLVAPQAEDLVTKEEVPA